MLFIEGKGDIAEQSCEMSIVVDDPQKEIQLLDAFMTYRITTSIEKSNDSREVHEVRRRYTDFEWLCDKLQEIHPGCLVPPLPGKNTLTNRDRFDREFVALRQAACQKFLRRVAAHAQLKLTNEFRIFLTFKTWELESYKKAHPNSNSLFAKMGAQVKQLSDRATNLQFGKSGVSSKSSALADDRFADTRELAVVSKERLHTFVSHLDEATTEERAIASNLTELSSLYAQFANNEDLVRPALQACVTALNLSSKSLTDRTERLRVEVTPTFREFENFAESVNKSLRNVDFPEAEYQRLTAQMERGGLNAQKHEQLAEVAKQMKQQSETIGNELYGDLQQWRNERHQEMRLAFLEFADAHIRQCVEFIENWEDAMHPIQSILDALKLIDAEAASNSEAL